MTYAELQSYRRLELRIQNLENDLAKLRARMEYVSPVLSFTGGARTHDKLGTQMAKMLSLEDRCCDMVLELYEHKDELDAYLATLPDTQAQVMKLRYVDGLSWRQVARKSGYSEKHVFKIHSAAIRKLPPIKQGAGV